MKRAMSAAFLVAAAGFGPGAAGQIDPNVAEGTSRVPVVLTEVARAVHRRGFVVDGHNDLPWAIRTKGAGSFEILDIARHCPQLHTDIGRLREGNVGAQFWSVYVPAETRFRGEAMVQTLEQIALVKSMCAKYAEVFELALTADDITHIQSQGKIASLIGIEGGHALENSLANLRRLYDLGARYLTLTHADTLSWADSATDEPQHGGLTLFGEDVVRTMNRLGMLVDLSHVSDETMEDALRVSSAPVIFSHSSARSIADHPRNVPDVILERLRENGGVVMVNFYSGFVVAESARRRLGMFEALRRFRREFPDEAGAKEAMRQWEAERPILPGTIHDVVDHIDHIVRVAGIDHVGLGSDFDGVTLLPRQLEDVSAYPYITQELLNRNYAENDIHKILGGNILRVMRQAEAIAKSGEDH